MAQQRIDEEAQRVEQGMTRRAVLRTLGIGVGGFVVWPSLSSEAAEALAIVQRTQAPATLEFLTAAQYETVGILSEAIIPADDHSPGAKAARVADYIDLLLAESDADTQKNWTEGLAALDKSSEQRHGAPFAKVSAAQAGELLTEISKNESAPESMLEKFFVATKDATIRGYYTSEIGIHEELEYKGNQYLPEFVGCTHPEHGYKDPKAQ
ncbi:MAG: hypothetical protein GEV06_06010 [Luteitalea sp.]|nr:hypothetical protein [Luteitalea sp.]